MIKCPKCGTDNSPDSQQCNKCQTALTASGPQPYRPSVAGPGITSAYRPAVAGPGIADQVIRSGGPLAGGGESDADTEGPVSVVGQPLGGYQNQQGGYQGPPPGAYGGPQTDPYGVVKAPPKLRYQEKPDLAPVKSRFWASMLGSLLMLAIILGGGAFAFWKYIYLPKGPITTMRSFVQASSTNDINGMQQCLSQKSQIIMAAAITQAQRYGKPFSIDFFRAQNQGFEEGKEYVLKCESVDQTTAKVLVQPGPAPIDSFKDEDLPLKLKNGIPVTLVKEGEQWKVDLQQLIMDIASAGSTASWGSGAYGLVR